MQGSSKKSFSKLFLRFTSIRIRFCQLPAKLYGREKVHEKLNYLSVWISAFPWTQFSSRAYEMEISFGKCSCFKNANFVAQTLKLCHFKKTRQQAVRFKYFRQQNHVDSDYFRFVCCCLPLENPSWTRNFFDTPFQHISGSRRTRTWIFYSIDFPPPFNQCLIYYSPPSFIAFILRRFLLFTQFYPPFSVIPSSLLTDFLSPLIVCQTNKSWSKATTTIWKLYQSLKTFSFSRSFLAEMCQRWG